MSYFQRENRELVSLDSCELIRSQFRLLSDYSAALALDYFAEVAEQLLPPAEANEKFFRLLLAVLEHLQGSGVAEADAGRVLRAVTYYSLWAVRLSGLLPELHVCLGCGAALDDREHPERAWFARGQPGLLCGHCRRAGGGSQELSVESRAIAEEMLRKPIAQLTPAVWGQSRAADLRRFLVQQMEEHVERRLITAPLIEQIASE